MAETNGTAGGRRRQWVFDVLDRSGEPASDGGDGVHVYTLRDPLAAQLGRERLEFTFRKRSARRAGVELATPGSWLHDQLLRYAAKWGRVSTFYLPESGLEPGRILARRRFAAGPGRCLERRYGLLVRFTFRLSYYTDPPRESLATWTFDAEQAKVLRRGPTPRQLEAASENPDPDVPLPPPFRLQDAFRRVWEQVEHQVEREAEALRQEGRPGLRDKLQTLENYYRQLIDEEKRTLKSRVSRKSREEGERRLDLLKLEWERRVQEETARLQPQVVARLCAVARIHGPLELYELELPGGTARIRVDRARNEAWRERSPAPAEGR